jgi:NADPH-dependent curcumin reductase CurA
MKNKQFLLASRPVGTPTRKNWDFVETEVAELGGEQVLVEVEYISLDPAMRGWMNDGKSYIEPVQIGAVMRAGTVGKVLKSTSSQFAEGDYVYGIVVFRNMP